jgi:uncharacterized membrane protein YgdD (TMEM256/DUF423 family)
MKRSPLLSIIALSGLLAVALGAYGAHGLKPYLSDYQHLIFEKGISYQFYHTLAAFAAYILFELKGTALFRTAAILFLIGIVGFSGSLYLLATHDLIGFPTAVAGPITPIGGLFFIGGWGCLLYGSVKN